MAKNLNDAMKQEKSCCSIIKRENGILSNIFAIACGGSSSDGVTYYSQRMSSDFVC